MSAALNLPDWVNNAHLAHGIFDDFNHYVSADTWTAVASNSGSVSVGDAVGGIATLDPSDSSAADNDEVYLPTTKELFKFVADKPIMFETRIQYSEANTDDANVAAGLMDAVGADSILDDGGGPKASYSGAVLFKADGDTVWSFETSVGGTQVTTQSTTTAGGSSYQRLNIEIKSHNSTKLEAIPYVDGVQLKDSNGNYIKHEITIGSATEMDVFVGLKNGSTNEESLLVDYISCWQKR